MLFFTGSFASAKNAGVRLYKTPLQGNNVPSKDKKTLASLSSKNCCWILTDTHTAVCWKYFDLWSFIHSHHSNCLQSHCLQSHSWWGRIGHFTTVRPMMQSSEHDSSFTLNCELNYRSWIIGIYWLWENKYSHLWQNSKNRKHIYYFLNYFGKHSHTFYQQKSWQCFQLPNCNRSPYHMVCNKKLADEQPTAVTMYRLWQSPLPRSMLWTILLADWRDYSSFYSFLGLYLASFYMKIHFSGIFQNTKWKKEKGQIQSHIIKINLTKGNFTKGNKNYYFY